MTMLDFFCGIGAMTCIGIIGAAVCGAAKIVVAGVMEIADERRARGDMSE